MTSKAYLKAGYAALLLTMAAAGGCGESKFRIQGKVDGADSGSIVIEKPGFQGEWVALDSTRIDTDGDFSIALTSPGAPEIYRLSLDGRYIYVPVDSVETITVATTLKGFGLDYTLEGSDGAKALAAFEKELMARGAGLPADSMDVFKRHVYTTYMQPNPGKIVTYYILTKTVGDKPLYNPGSGDDYKYFAAVATAYRQHSPSDPHTPLLEAAATDAMKMRNKALGRHTTIAAEELRIIDIALQDENGSEKKLSQVAGKGKKTVVAFSLLTAPESPAFNRELLKIYRNRGVEIYNVSLDPDRYAWRDAAANLPWTTVYDPEGEYSTTARDYNVTELPAFFVYSPEGELVARASNFEELNAMLQ